jgi:hypothetical protein
VDDDGHLVGRAAQHDAHGGARGAVLDGVAHEIGDRLAEPRAVPPPAVLAPRLDPDAAGGVHRAHLVDRVAHHLAEAQLAAGDRDPVAQAAAREVEQVADQRQRPPGDDADAGGECAVRLVQVPGLQHELGGRRDRAERGAQVVAEDGEERLLRVGRVPVVAGDRLRERLVDGLVEARELLDGAGAVQVVGRRPAPHDARAQRAVLGDHLRHGEPAPGAPLAVLPGRRRGAARLGGREDPRPPVARARRLRGREAAGDHPEHHSRVVAQRARVHQPARGRAAAREGLPLDQDLLAVRSDEVDEAHRAPRARPGRRFRRHRGRGRRRPDGGHGGAPSRTTSRRAPTASSGATPSAITDCT